MTSDICRCMTNRSALMKGKDARRQVQGLNKRLSVGSDDTHLTTSKVLAGIVAGPVCQRFQAGIEQDETRKDTPVAVVKAISKGRPIPALKKLDQSVSPAFRTKRQGS